MSIIDTLIIDRTQADAELARRLSAMGWAAMTDEQRALYLSDQLKGAYKASDLNRVNAAMDYLVGRLKAQGINVALKRTEIHSETSDTIEVSETLTGDSISRFFSVENGSYYFAPENGVWTSNNGGVNSSTASTKFTALRDMSVSFGYSYSSEAKYDKFTLSVAGTVVEDAVSGTTTTKTYSAELHTGDAIELTYAKDSSQNTNDDKCTLFDFVASYTEEIIVPSDKEPYLWYDSDVPTPAQFAEYLANVSSVRSALRAALPEIPADMDDGLTIAEANNIELVLVNMEQLINNMLSARVYCAEIYSGEV